MHYVNRSESEHFRTQRRATRASLVSNVSHKEAFGK
jgi:hypothetical protein